MEQIIVRFECPEPNCTTHFSTRMIPTHDSNGRVCNGSGQIGERVEAQVPPPIKTRAFSLVPLKIRV